MRHQRKVLELQDRGHLGDSLRRRRLSRKSQGWVAKVVPGEGGTPWKVRWKQGLDAVRGPAFCASREVHAREKGESAPVICGRQ